MNVEKENWRGKKYTPSYKLGSDLHSDWCASMGRIMNLSIADLGRRENSAG